MKTVEPGEKRSCMWGLVVMVLLFFPCFSLGILFIGGSIYYLDCDRSSGQVSCAITTRFLGTFNTEKRTASGVTAALEAEQECGEDSCPTRIELVTPSGTEPLSNDYSRESKPEAVKQINTYLADPDQPTLHMKVVYWTMFVISGVAILFGGAGLFGMLFTMKKVGKVKTGWRDIVRERKSEGTAPGVGLPAQVDSTPPSGLRMDRELNQLRFRYRHPAWKGLVFIGLSLFLVVLSWAYDEPILDWFFYILALIFAYLGLATLVNQWIIQVTYDELKIRYAPLPFYHRRRIIPSREIKQMYVGLRTVYTRYGNRTYYAMEAILQDNRRVTLISELPHSMLRYIEAQIESWLKIEDRWVEGEALQGEKGIADQLSYEEVSERTGIKASREGLPGLTHPEQVIYRIHELGRYVVHHDFQGYFSSPAADDVLEAVLAFEETGARQTADVVRRAMALFPGGAPALDVEARRPQLEAMNAAQRETLGELSWQFQEVEDVEFYRIEAYIHAHRAEIAAEEY